MSRWPLQLELDRQTGTPVFAAIARAIAAQVQRGRLRAGDRLPSTRELATQLEVHRNTVVAAYRELLAEGWITSGVGRGSFVAEQLADTPARRREPVHAPERMGFALPPSPLRRGPLGARETIDDPRVIGLHTGLPDPSSFPREAIARAYRRALRDRTLLGYRDRQGHPRLRAAFAQMLASTRALACTADDVLVTRGSQMALDLVARTLVRPGSVVAVEGLGYRPAWDTFAVAGAELLPIPVDAQGLQVDALAAALAKQRIAAVYVTPHHQFPSLATLAPQRRLALLELARAHRFAIVEDDYDHEFHYRGRPVAPLASLDRHGVVVYVATLSKVLAPGLRIGCAIAPRPLLAAMTELRELADRQGDAPLEAALAELLEDGLVQRHVRRMRRVHAERREVLATELRRALGSSVRFELPGGGMALWLDVDPAIDVDAWVTRARAQGVRFAPGSAFDFEARALPHARIGFCAHAPARLREGVRRMAAALPRRRLHARTAPSAS